jgi:hypothetical protein
MDRIDQLFQQFLRERIYLKNVTPKTRIGHSEISTTMKYLHLLTEDLQRPHQGLSILNRLR